MGKMGGQLQAIMKNPGALVLEVLHTAAFRGGLANQFVWSGAPLSQQAARDFVATNITGPRVVIAASGCDHKDLLAVSLKS
jgi:processing peptidase subunit alpha